MLSGCAVTTVTPSTEVRLLDTYAQVAQSRTLANDKLARGELSPSDWRVTMTRIEEAGASLDGSMNSLNHDAAAEADAGIATSQRILANTQTKEEVAFTK